MDAKKQILEIVSKEHNLNIENLDIQAEEVVQGVASDTSAGYSNTSSCDAGGCTDLGVVTVQRAPNANRLQQESFACAG